VPSSLGVNAVFPIGNITPSRAEKLGKNSRSGRIRRFRQNGWVIFPIGIKTASEGLIGQFSSRAGTLSRELAKRSSPGWLEELVEALNISSQVQQYTLEEYRNEFDDLKKALTRHQFSACNSNPVLR
jgi:hypothetical protein